MDYTTYGLHYTTLYNYIDYLIYITLYYTVYVMYSVTESEHEKRAHSILIRTDGRTDRRTDEQTYTHYTYTSVCVWHTLYIH